MKPDYLVSRVRSFSHALRGGRWLVTTQAHARLHLVATLIVGAAGMALKVSHLEALLLGWCMAAVWMAEAFNTALEFLADELTMEWRERIGKAKDVAAFAVLVIALMAAVTGLSILGPRFIQLLVAKGAV